MINDYDEGYSAFFSRVPYNQIGNSLDWHKGWNVAEKESNCGWFNRDGSPNRGVNKE